MRRSGSVARKILGKSTLVLGIAMFPGIIGPVVNPAPAVAGPHVLGLPPRAVSPEQVDELEVPVQLPGEASGLPHLVGADATRSLDLPPGARSQQEGGRPEGALPPERRHRRANVPASGGLKSPPPLPDELLADTSPGGAPAVDPDQELALAKARETGERALIGSAATETSLTYANPDGTLTTEVGGDVARVRQGSVWVPVDLDLDLAEVGGVLRPGAAKADVSFSAGGAGPAVRLSKDGDEWIALTWPTPLPEPVVSGNKAKYVDAAGPGADLVLTMLATGFSQDVVLRERPDGPVEIRMGVEGEGLSLAETSSGGLRVTSESGGVVASAPEPVMYDSSVAAAMSAAASPSPTASPDPSAAASVAAAVSRIAEIDTRVETEDGRRMLVLEPDADFLADPDTVYPVTVDPTITLNPSTDVYVDSSEPASSFAGDSVLAAGGGFGDQIYRAFLAFSVPSLAGATVSSAWLQLQDDIDSGSFLCGSVQVSRVTSSWGAGTTWNTRPSMSSTGSASATVSGVGVIHGECDLDRAGVGVRAAQLRLGRRRILAVPAVFLGVFA